MPLTLSEEERNALERAQARSPKVRHWRRYQAVLLRAAGVLMAEVARNLGCSEAGVSNWTAAWQTEGLVGIREPPGGSMRQRRQRWTPSGPSDARCTVWGGDGNGPSMSWDGPTRRTRRKKAVAQQAAAIVAAGGEVWFGDETTRREFPPLRAAWARRGQQQIVVISGRNAWRLVHGALNVATGEFASRIRERSRQNDCAAFVDALGQLRPHVPKLLVWDNAPPHHPKRVQAAAAAANIRQHPPRLSPFPRA